MTITNDELKDLVASLAVSQAKTDKQIAEMKQQVEDTSRTLKNLGLNVDGIGKTTGQETQEFFYTSFKKNKKLNNIQQF